MAFLVLSLKFGPFITIAYLRRGSFSGMTVRDWGVFIASWLLGNVLWIFILYGGISGLQSLF